MAVVEADMEFRLTGGAINTAPNLALGGVISYAEPVGATLENLFASITAAEASAGVTKYRCIYIANTNDTDTLSSAVVYIGNQTTSADTSLEIGLDPAGIGDGMTTGVATTVANDTTAPSGVTFSAPSTPGTGLSIGNLDAGEAQAIWVKLIVNSSAASTSMDAASINVEGTS